jgi:hypothetical protein
VMTVATNIVITLLQISRAVHSSSSVFGKERSQFHVLVLSHQSSVFIKHIVPATWRAPSREILQYVRTLESAKNFSVKFRGI